MYCHAVHTFDGLHYDIHNLLADFSETMRRHALARFCRCAAELGLVPATAAAAVKLSSRYQSLSCEVGCLLLIAKFHYTDPTGPARTQRSFAAKKVRAGPVWSVSDPCRVRVVEFSY